MKGRRCPTCKKAIDEAEGEPTFPFCSLRCKTIDLGSWLDERYRLATDDAPSEDELDR